MSSHPLPTIGWREWVALPLLDIAKVKAKIDTGARSSSLHAFDIQSFERDGVTLLRFVVHPVQRDVSTTIVAEAVLLDERSVRNSGGHAELRPVIQTMVMVGQLEWPIELTLTDRDAMGFRMLLGRQAVRRRFLVDAGESYLLSATHHHPFVQH